ncbi:MAG: AraC family transcriptional regulator [Bacteroidota bacterium]
MKHPILRRFFTENLHEISPPDKYHCSHLSPEVGKELYKKILLMFAAEQIYLDTHLSLKRLAQQVATNTTYVSQVINQYTGCSFKRFINIWRLYNFLEKVPQHHTYKYTLKELALTSGFQSFTTFYRTFKKELNMSPKKYFLKEVNRTDAKSQYKFQSN